MSQPIVAPKNPNLPLAPLAYERQYTDQNNNALRLYFNQIDNTFAAIVNSRGGSSLNFPYAAIQRTSNQTFAANTATQITFDKNDYINGCTNDGTDGIHVQVAGLYNYQFSVQWANPDTSVHTTYIWLRVNNLDLAGTASKFDVPSKHGSSDGYLVAAANFYVQLNPGDFVQMYAAADSTSPYMEAYTAQTTPFPMPSIPSIVATLSFVSSVTT
jgi:hypothetical protein